MNALLWPATFGYLFWQLVAPLLTDAGNAEAAATSANTSAPAGRSRPCASALSRTACCRSLAGSVAAGLRRLDGGC